jgi:hypothetical protein
MSWFKFLESVMGTFLAEGMELKQRLGELHDKTFHFHEANVGIRTAAIVAII